jgi:hypothetical protein
VAPSSDNKQVAPSSDNKQVAPKQRQQASSEQRAVANHEQVADNEQ